MISVHLKDLVPILVFQTFMAYEPRLSISLYTHLIHALALWSSRHVLFLFIYYIPLDNNMISGGFILGLKDVMAAMQFVGRKRHHALE